MKKQNATFADKLEILNTKLEEDTKRKASAMHERVIGWAEIGSPKEDANNLG